MSAHVSALEANLWEMHRDFARVPGAAVHDDADLLWYTLPSTNGWLNGASWSNLDPRTADDRIAEAVEASDIVVTADIPLASRCLARGAFVIGTTGRPFTEDNIGDALATRELLSELRGAGEVTRGPAPFAPRDRSRFLQALDEAVHTKRRG